MLQPLHALLLIALGGCCFLPSLHAGFVYDDSWTIVHNSALRRAETIPQLFSGEAMAQGVPDAWRPLMVLSQMADYWLFGLNARGHHAQSLLWHLACVFALWLLAWRLQRRSISPPMPGDLSGGEASGELPLIAAGLFAVHPVHVEAVSAINYREDLLVTALVLLSLILALPAADACPQTPNKSRSRGWGRALLSATALLGALLAKESAVVTPGLAALLLLCSGTWRHSRWQALPPLLAQATAVGIYLAWRVLATGGIDPYPALGIVPPAATLSLGERLVAVAATLAGMLQSLLWPLQLAPEYPPPGGGSAAVLGAVLLPGLVCAALLLYRHGMPLAAAGVGFMLLAWLPTSGILPLPAPRADRHVYLPSVGACLLLADMLMHLSHPLLRRAVTAVLFLPLIILCSGQQPIWRSEQALWQSAVKSSPDSGHAWSGLAAALAGEGHHQPGLTAARRAVALSPSSGNVRLVLANALARQGRFAEALEHFAHAASLGTRHPGLLYANWGWALHLAGRPLASQQVLERGLELAPRLALLHLHLARVLLASGDTIKARVVLQQALAFAPERRHEIQRLLTEAD